MYICVKILLQDNFNTAKMIKIGPKTVGVLQLAELQIIFEPNAYLPPTFWLNADFQNFKWYFHPLYFFAMLKREVLLLFSVYLQFCAVLDISFVVICFGLWYYIAN